jgi:nitric oxide reductase activation protein
MLLLVGWLMVPVAIAAWHYGPGQERMRLDDVATLLAAAERHVADQDWAAAVEKYDEALRMLPAGRTREARHIRLERAKAQMLAKKLPAAHADLQSLVDELSADATGDQQMLSQARSALANSRYYMTWLMRLEGQPREDWEPEIEAARQTYRLLAEQAEAAGNPTAAKKNREDLEAAVRLARMDLSELQGLPLPSQ